MSFYAVQALTGLASACSLFLVASGLSIIFGVTRIVNFAHGAFYMLGAYLAYALTETLSGAFGFWGGLLLAAAFTAIIGAIVEIVLLRRIYGSPELFQLLATFGLTLMAQDLVVLIWGAEDLIGRRAPGLRGAVEIFGQSFPTYDLMLIALGPIVFVLLQILFHRTRWGVLVRAATEDRDMTAALGVNQKSLFTGAFALGVFLAGLGGALQISRGAASHTMDLTIIVEVFAVVVIGGLGSISGAFLAAIIVAEANAFGILIFPQISIVVIFLTMAAVLIIRPSGFLGRPDVPARTSSATTTRPWRLWNGPERIAVLFLFVLAASAPFGLDEYGLIVATEILIFTLFAASLHFMMGPGGLASFGHAAYFGLGAYGAALATTKLGFGMEAALACGAAMGLVGAALFGWICVRRTGVYLAMLTLAFAQITWSAAFQSIDLTGGDNGVRGVARAAWAAGPEAFYWLTFGFVVLSLAALRRLVFSPFGHSLRAARDSPKRAEAIGLDRMRLHWTAFMIAGGFAAVTGALFAFFKTQVYPDVLGIGLSVDALAMVLLGGVGTVSGAVVGAVLYKGFSIWLVAETDYSKLILGASIVLLAAVFPSGTLGAFQHEFARRV